LERGTEEHLLPGIKYEVVLNEKVNQDTLASNVISNLSHHHIANLVDKLSLQ
jgi:hypothetical protein